MRYIQAPGDCVSVWSGLPGRGPDGQIQPDSQRHGSLCAVTAGHGAPATAARRRSGVMCDLGDTLV